MIRHRIPAMVLSAAILATPAATKAVNAKGAHDPAAVRIDVPVRLAKADVVFNMDHLAFTGDMPIGIKYMDLLAKRYAEWKTKGKIVAVFHGPAGYLTLNDKAYNTHRHVSTGNPYKELIASLIKEGVEIEECAFAMKTQGWQNTDLLPGVRVTTGAIARIVELVQQGYVQIQP